MERPIVKELVSWHMIEEEKNHAELISERQKLELALHSSDVGFWHYFLQEEEIDFDNNWLGKKLNYVQHFFKSENVWKKIIHPDDLQGVLKYFREMIQGKREIFDQEFRLQKKDGSYLWIVGRAKIVCRDREGHPQKVSGLYRDIHEQKTTEIQLRQELDLQNLLGKIQNKAEETDDIESSLKQCLKLICDFIEWPLGHLYVFDKTKGELACQYCSFENPKHRAFVKESEETIFKPHEGLVGRVFATDKPYWVDKLSDFPNYKRKKSAKNTFESCVAIPIKGNPSAVVEFYHEDPIEKDEQILKQLNIVVKQLGYLLKRRKTQQELAEREKKFRYLAKYATDKVTVLDAEANCIYVSPSTEDLLGYTPEEYMEKDVIEIVHPEDQKVLRQNLAALSEGEGKKHITFRLKHKNGHYLWVDTSLNLLYDGDGNLQEIRSTTRDVSDRIAYEQELEKEKEFTAKALNSFPGFFYVLDRKNTFIKVNDGFKDELGYTLDELDNMSPLDFHYEEDHKQITQFIEKAFNEDKAEIITRLKKKDGTDGWYHLTGSHFMQNGKNYVLGTGINISERKQAEKLLEEQRNLLSKLFDNAPVGIAMVDGQNEILSVNKSFERIFGYSADNIIGKDINRLITPKEYRPKQKEIIQKQREGKDSFQYESVRLRKGGAEVPVLIGLVPAVKNKEAELNYLIYVDITERRTHLEKIKNSLSEKQVLLQEVHHRVKNNLAIISSLLFLEAMNWEEDSIIYKVLQQSNLRIQSMAKIHEKLYESEDFSNIKLADYFSDLVDTIYESMKVRDMGLKMDVDCDNVSLNINQALPCALILNELVTNALKYAFEDRSNGKLEVKLKRDNDLFTMVVADDGPGLPEDFETMTNISLGHRLVSQLVKQIEGEIDVESNEELGTRYKITFNKMNRSGSSSNL